MNVDTDSQQCIYELFVGYKRMKSGELNLQRMILLVDDVIRGNEIIEDQENSAKC